MISQETEAIIEDHAEALMRLVTILAQTAIDAGTLTERHADEFVDELAELLGFDMDELEIIDTLGHPASGLVA